MNPATMKHSPRSRRTAAPSHPVRSSGHSHQSPSGTLSLGFRESAPTVVTMSSISRPVSWRQCWTTDWNFYCIHNAELWTDSKLGRSLLRTMCIRMRSWA